VARARGPTAKDRSPTPATRPAPRSASRRKRARRREQAQRAQAHAGGRSRRFWFSLSGGVAAGAAILIVLLVVILRVGSGPSGAAARAAATPTPDFLAPVGSAASGAAIDAIRCDAGEQTAFHVHAHLAIYVNGAARQIPEGVGIPAPRKETESDAGPYVTSGKCFYWLNTHTNDGIIHVAAPTQQTFTLGEFFDVWGQQLSANQVGPVTGTVIAYVDGQRYSGAARDISLDAHAIIQLDVGQDVAPKAYQFPVGY
jgi:hypothetical protein